MRRRRAERCVIHATEALAAGNEEAAAAALAEARDLSPLDTPELETLRMRTVVSGSAHPVEGPVDLRPGDAHHLLADAPLFAPTAHTGGTGHRRTLAAAVVVLGLAIAGVALSTGNVAPSPAPPASASLQQKSVSPVVRTTPATSPTLPPPAPSEVQTAPEPRAQDVVPAAVPAPPPSSGASEPGPVRAAYAPPPPTVGTAGDETLPAVVGSTPSIAVAPPEPLPAPPPSIPVAPLESAGAPAAPIARTPPPSPPAPDPIEPRIRAVLSSYAAAFGSLDAAAVHRVWPGVDERSLARAFDGLASQAVSLGDCAISVQGETATAKCQGSATWAPKVGGGSRTEARRWEFALHNAGASWLIVRADVR